MGLDIDAHSKLEPADPPRLENGEIDWDTAYDEGYVHAFAFKGFEASTRGLHAHDVVTTNERGHEWIAESWYRTTPESHNHSFRAGSYSGYNRFRELLAGLMDKTVEQYWNSPSTADQPFYELINFADNEGTIGPEAAADLLIDFRDNRDRWVTFIEKKLGAGDGDYEIHKYDDWIKAFELAADGGLVQFH